MDKKQYFVGLGRRNVELNAALERMLGIDLESVYSVTICLQADEAATVVIERYLDDRGALEDCIKAMPMLAPVRTAKAEYVCYVQTDGENKEGTPFQQEE